MYFASIGMVTTPISVSVDMRAATCGRPAPVFSNIDPVEKATKVGIITMLPIMADNTTPKAPELLPNKLEIVSGLSKARVTPTTIIMPRN